MGHTAVQTSVADGFLAVEAPLFQVLIRPRLRHWPSVFRDVAFLHRPGAPQLDLLMPRVLEVMAMEWESLNAKAELACMHREGHCHEAVMWYVHHLPKSMKTLTLCESKADPRWKRVTEGRRPKDRS